MKILNCHIENFGRLHDCTFDFTTQENILCRENGWGKSTFAAFLRVMFYGLEGDRKRSLENERRRYMPWQGGVYGGQLTFEAGGKQYVISRIFRDKDANDEFELRDALTNKKSSDFSSNLGEELFRINRASFLRTVFIGQNDCTTETTDDINAKIGNLSDNTNDMNNFESANKTLTDLLNQMTAKRSTGLLYKLNSEITTMEQEVKAGENIEVSIDRYQALLKAQTIALEQEKQQLAEVTAKQGEVSRLQTALAKKENYEVLCSNLKKKKEDLEEAKKKFFGAVPDKDEVSIQLANCRKMEEAGSRVSMYRLEETEQSALAKYAECFWDGTPSEEEIVKMLEDNRKLTRLRQEIVHGQLTEEEQGELERLKLLFADGDEVDAYINKWNERTNRRSTLSMKLTTLSALKATAMQQNTGKKAVNLLFVVGVFLAVLGLALCFVNQIPGVVVVATGIILTVIGLLTGTKKMQKDESPVSVELIRLEKEIEADQNNIAQAEVAIEKYLTAHGMRYAEEVAADALQKLLKQSIALKTLQEKAVQADRNPAVAAANELSQKIRSFLEKYDQSAKGYGNRIEESDFADALYGLSKAVSNYEKRKKQKQNYDDAADAFLKQKDSILDFLRKYNFTPEEPIMNQLLSINNAVIRYAEAETNYQEAEKARKTFAQENDIAAMNAALPKEELPSLTALQEEQSRMNDRISQMNEIIAGYRRTIGDLQEKYDEWAEQKEILAFKKDQRSKMQKKYGHIDQVKTFLTEAKESLTMKYTGPIYKGFQEYYALLSNQDAGNYHIDAGTKITVDACGKQRETTALSAGYQDMIGFCLRIALIDAMYQKESPVLIMDDPFINLDEEKAEAAMRLLKKIAEKYQIIYFTCHSSRS